jgi:5-methylcytosine-specific restriction endonuclease McrA
MSPACEWCGSTNNLQADHIVTIKEDPALRLCIENVRVLCADDNRNRRPTTDAERQAVYAAVERRRQRTQAL